MEIELLAAGFGGQGVMIIGQLIAAAAVEENKFALFYPSYGPAMRGGTANCTVITSDQPIGSPIVIEHQNVLVMNLPSFDKFEKSVQKGGRLFVNSSLIDKKSDRKDIQPFYIPSNEIALETGSNLAANIVVLGAFLKATSFVKKETLEQTIKTKFERKGEKVVDINIKALNAGYNLS
jgi:2-oxoglutarate ferredoxin oxidoreductase subunit gamma